MLKSMFTTGICLALYLNTFHRCAEGFDNRSATTSFPRQTPGQTAQNQAAPSHGPAPNFDLVGYATLNGRTTGGEGGEVVEPKTVEEFQNFSLRNESLIIRIVGTLSAGPNGLRVSMKSNKTIIGAGDDAFLEGIGLHISGRSNIIIRNIKMTMSTINSKGTEEVDVNDGDCITIINSKNIWIDHCEFFNINPLINTNKDLYDGLVDINQQSDHITISYNYMHDHHKAHNVGNNDYFEWDTRVTFHHNYFHNIASRLPLVRFGHGHVFNNFYKIDETNVAIRPSISSVNSRMGACLRVERNVFDNKAEPIFTNGSRIDGQWDVAENVYVNNCNGSQPTNSTCKWDAPYDYSCVLDDVKDVQDVVTKWAGVGKMPAYAYSGKHWVSAFEWAKPGRKACKPNGAPVLTQGVKANN